MIDNLKNLEKRVNDMEKDYKELKEGYSNLTSKLEKIFFELHLNSTRNMVTYERAYLNMMSHLQEAENDN